MSKSRGRRDKRRERPAMDIESWVPQTEVGHMVKKGTITSIYDIFRDSLKISDVNIIDFLVPNLTETVLDVGRVQRQTHAGRKTLFVATAGVGNKNGIVGVAQAKAAGVGTAIRNAIVLAKLNIVPIKRGCGSWECTCSNPHSIPFQVEGKVGSVRVVLKPAPKGLGLVIGDVAKSVLELAGIFDIWSKTFGDTRTTQNFCKATFEGLKSTYNISHVSDWGE
ncbi:MAG: 30S ribosomal protein S5 [Candidatus Heimdallarchaeota archaeon]|nr:30S ribosomal protein S5 [Candidatus Heimdallarchaeota archaeon]